MHADRHNMAPEGFWCWDLNSDRVNLSPFFYGLAGYSPEDTIFDSNFFRTIIHPDDYRHVLNAIEEYLQEKRNCFFITYRIISKDASVRWIESRGSIVEFDDQGIPARVVGSFIDFTERKQAEEALRESDEELFENMFRAHNAVMLLMEPETFAIIDANAAAEKFYGFSREKLLNMTIFDINTLSPEEIISELLNAQALQRYDFIFPHRIASGEIRTVEVHSTPIKLHNSTLRFAIIHDITERKRSEKELAESQSLLRGIIDSTSDMIRSVDSVSFGLRSFNRSLSEYYLKEHNIAIEVGMRPEDLLPGEYAQQWHSFYKRALEEGSFTTEYETYAKTNILLLNFNPLKVNGTIFGVSVFGKDITELKRAESLLAESESRYRTLVDNIPLGINLIDRDHRIVMVNNTMAKWFGHSPEWFVGRYCFEVFEKRQNICPHCPGLESMGSGKLCMADTEKVREDGSSFSVRLYTVPINLADGNMSGFIDIVEDITESKKMMIELQKKNTDMEQFIYTVFHDLRTPLVTMKIYLGFLQNDMIKGSQEQITQDLQFINSATDKMKLLLDELLELNRIDRVQAPPVKILLMDVLSEVLEVMAGVITKRRVDIRLPDTDLVLFGDRQCLCKIWQTLVENAIKYNFDGSIPRIEIGMQQMSGELTFFVKDNGIGIDPQYHIKIFGLFEKLDQNSPGAGLGLSMIQRIVEKYGGRIWVESEGIGKGSCFYFTLPQVVVQG